MSPIPSAPWSAKTAALVVTGNKIASFTSEEFGTDRVSQLIIEATIGTVTGTSPTLNLYLQTKMPDETWRDIAAFAQFTVAGSQILGMVSGGNSLYAGTDGGLAAGTVKSMPLGAICRLKGVVAGTNPLFPATIQLILLA